MSDEKRREGQWPQDVGRAGQSPRDTARSSVLDASRLPALFESAGQREDIDQAWIDELTVAARASWREGLTTSERGEDPVVSIEASTRQGSRGSWPALRTLALAAGLVLAVGAGWMVRDFFGTEAGAGSTGSARGTATWASLEVLGSGLALADAGLVASGGALERGRRYSTDTLPVALARGAQSIRIDAHSIFAWQGGSVLQLEAGGIYIDSPEAAGADEAWRVRTALGVVQEIGTQFEVRIDEDVLTARVREGQVEIFPSGDGVESEVAFRGESMTVDRAGTVRRQTITPFDSTWSWTLVAGPPLDADGLTLEQIVAWVERETHWNVEWSDARLESQRSQDVVRGKLLLEHPGDALQVVAPTFGLRAIQENPTTVRLESEG